MLSIIRTLESLIYPVGFLWLWLGVLAVVFWRRKLRGPAKACGVVVAFLYLVGATPIPGFLMARLERPFANCTVERATSADVVIVLGGNVNASAHDTFQISLNSSADRIVTGVELLRLKKVNAMIVGGGAAKIGSDDVSEGRRVENWLKNWKVADGVIIGLPACANTHEEALRSQALMQEQHWTNAILVTSASHMARAVATFEKQGIRVRPVACDFEGLPVVESESLGFRLVPVMEHLKTLTLYLHEVIGWYYYSARGWI